MARDDFSYKTLDILAKRVGFKCSNPGCKQTTSGPRTETDKIVNIGVGAHITAASEGGPRYDPQIKPEERQAVDNGFSYLLKSEDLAYWSGSNLPIIIVLYRQSDESYYWQDVRGGTGAGERKLLFDKKRDVLDRDAVDRLANLTVPKSGFGYYIPPLGGGEEALVNILPVTLPDEIYVSSTPHTAKQAAAILLDGNEPPRFDWVIRGGSLWSFQDPRNTPCRNITAPAFRFSA